MKLSINDHIVGLKKIQNISCNIFLRNVSFVRNRRIDYIPGTFTIVVGSTDGNTFRTEGKGRTTATTLADGKLLPCIATRV